MRPAGTARRLIVALLCASLALSGCSTAQLQKKHTTFESCFRSEKTNAMLIGGLAGGLLGVAVGGGGKNSAAPAVVLAGMGALIGNRIAWQSCMDAFPVKSQTAVTVDRTAAMAQGGMVQTQAVAKTLVIQSISASPLEFGKDLDVVVEYRYLSDKPADRDIKARIHRNLVFQAPDGSQQEVNSSTEDTIQQGVSRARFAIPTPSVADAKELLSTSNLRLKFAIETEGLRQEQVVSLRVPQLIADGNTASVGLTLVPTSGSATAPSAASAVPPAQAPASSAQETIYLKRGTALYQQPNTSVLVVRLPAAQPVSVLQRVVQSKFQWVQVRLKDGKEGWFRGAAQ